MSNNFNYNDVAVTKTQIVGDLTEILTFSKYEDFLDFHNNVNKEFDTNNPSIKIVPMETK